MELSKSYDENSDGDELKDACGVFACILNEGVQDVNVANVVYLGLIALQHRLVDGHHKKLNVKRTLNFQLSKFLNRGQECAGIVTGNGKDEQMRLSRSRGLVSNAFNQEEIERLGHGAIFYVEFFN